jgi:hypothetical protein
MNKTAQDRADLKILVASHKPYWMPRDDIYLPVKVGAACNKATMSGFQRDDTGDNISDRNPNYCELTALYWAWKNLDADYVGLAHYRRHFKGTGPRQTATRKDLEPLLAPGRVLVPRKRNYVIETVESHYRHAHENEPLDVALELVRGQGGAYAAAAEKLFSGTQLSLYNMFVMEKAAMDAYCAWLFPLLDEVAGRIDISGYSKYEARVYGFLAERLFNVWLEASGLDVVEVACVNLEDQNWPRKIARFLGRKLGLTKGH